MADGQLELNGKYWLLVDGQKEPVLVDGWEIVAAIKIALPASYWPKGEKP